MCLDPEHDRKGPKSLRVLAELRDALRSGQLSLHFQPKVDILTGELAGCEALLRWCHPERGMVPPDVFIAVEEAGDLMRPLTPWVLRDALAALCSLRQHGIEVPVAINVSAHNLLDTSFPERVEALLREADMDPKLLALEITETVLMSSPERTEQVIHGLHALGLGMDIDDFGTGYSSMAYLRRLPLRSIKIDRTFIQSVVTNESDQVIVHSIIALGHGLGLRIVAEGVEDRATLEFLRDNACDLAQGYYIGRPRPLAEFVEWVQAWRVAPYQTTPG